MPEQDCGNGSVRFQAPFSVASGDGSDREKSRGPRKTGKFFLFLIKPSGPAGKRTMAGIYYHIPFCKRICAYCDFFRSAALARMDEVLETMHRELEARRSYLGSEPIRTRYFGGGTPSLCTPRQIARLVARTESLFDCRAVEETTLEANPDDLDAPYLDALLEAGIDRLSIGIQSLDDGCLRLMNRRHTAARALEAIRTARRAGFGNLTADLIFGVPGFGGESLRRTLDGFLELGIPHISAYHLTVEPRTLFGRRAARGEFTPVEEAVSEREFLEIHETLTRAGYEHYEVSNYALPGFRARHNAAYWHGEKYLGIGPGAHSYDGATRCWNLPSLDAYTHGTPPETELLTDRDRYNEYVMTRLRTSEGIDLGQLRSLFGAQRTERLLRAAEPWRQAGHLVLAEGRAAVPPERFLVSDAVIEALFES